MRVALCDLVFEQADARPDAIATSYADTQVTYSQLGAEVRRVAAGYRALGLQSGDRIAVYLEKRIETVAAIFAASAAACAVVPINPVLKPHQVAHILADSGARLLVTSEPRARGLGNAVVNTPELGCVLVGGAAEGSPGSISWESLGGQRTRDFPPPIDLDLAAILYTSGSTGSPKGVALTHRNMIAGAESVNGYLPNSSDEVILAVLPLSFDAGLSQLTTGFAAGAHVVLHNYLLPQDVVRACERYGVTAITCVPPLWHQLSDLDWAATGRRLRYFASTGGRMPKVTLEKLRGHFPSAEPYLMYGLTEAFRSTYLDPCEIDDRPDSIGKAIPNTEILVVAPDGSLCGPNEPGELVHRGALVALGYWGDPHRTSERFRPLVGPEEEWRAPERAVWSGDIVRRDEDGFLYFVGRRDEMIKSSGYRISPTELEEAALSTTLVREAVALGVQDDALGQRIVLVVANNDEPVDAEALRRRLRRDLPSFMIPTEIVVRPALPRGVNGKHDRTAIRADYGG